MLTYRYNFSFTYALYTCTILNTNYKPTHYITATNLFHLYICINNSAVHPGLKHLYMSVLFQAPLYKCKVDQIHEIFSIKCY